MHRLTAAALLFVLFGAVHGLRNHLARSHARDVRDFPRDKMTAERQASNCSFPNDYPETCVAAEARLSSVLGTSPEQVNLDDLRNVIDDFCTTECVEPYVELYTCLAETNLLVYYNNLLCGMTGNDNCVVVYYQNMVIDDNIGCVQPRTTCDAACRTAQETVVNEWGCCAAGYYAFLEATCDVDAGDPCDGLVNGSEGGIVNRVGLGLITIFAMVAAYANAVLF